MAYTNSKMVAYTKLSPNHSGQRTHSIDRITPHCVVSQCTAEGLGDWFVFPRKELCARTCFSEMQKENAIFLLPVMKMQK